MASIFEFNRNFKRLIQEMAEQQATDALQVSFDLAAQVKLRIQESGQDASGVAFATYTSPYERVRTDRGRQIEHFDFLFTGEAWRSFTPQVIAQRFGEVEVEIAFRGKNRAKAEGQYKKRGNFVTPTQEEIANTLGAYIETRVARLKKGLEEF